MKILGWSLLLFTFSSAILTAAPRGTSANDPTPKFTWTRGIIQNGLENFTESHGIATDPNGNVYVAGSFNGEISFGTTNFVKIQSGDLFYEDSYFAKFSPGGELLWVKRGTTVENHVLGWDVVCDKAGNAYFLGGVFLGGDFGDVSFSGVYGSVIIKYDPKGGVIWSRIAHSTEPLHIALDADENVILTGTYVFGAADFGNGVTLPPIGDFQFFVAKYDSAGNALWARSQQNNGLSTGRAVGIAPNGDISVAGGFAYEMQMDDTTLSSTGFDMFVVTYGGDGSLKWVKQSNIGDVQVNGLGVDQGGNVFVCGMYTGAGSLGDINLEAGVSRMFLTRLNEDGTFAWAKTMSGAVPSVLLVDDSGKLQLAGGIRGAVTFGGKQLNTLGPDDGFWATCDTAGTFTSALQLGGNSSEGVTTMAVDSHKNLFLSGLFVLDGVFGNQVLSSPYCSSVFVSKLVIGGTK